MITVRRGTERLHTSIGWLDSYHSFSFAKHYDPRYMSYRALRVLNEDRIAPGHGFGTHSHRDMEIITYVLEGALRHEDSLGTGAILKAGDVQRVTAGTGVLHSEHNASSVEPLHLLQTWIAPSKSRLRPSYEQRHFTTAERTGRLRLIASSDGREASLTIHQDADVFACILPQERTVRHETRAGRHRWLQLISGAVTLNDVAITQGDGAAVDAERDRALTIRADESAEFLLFDLE